MKPIHTFKFKKNYNNKMNCEFFTTIRGVKAPVEVGDIAYCHVVGTPQESRIEVEVMVIIPTRLKKINTLISYLDAGLSQDDFAKLMQNCYKRDLTIGVIYVYLLKRRTRLW